VIYQHPLAYLLGLEGVALLRGWVGDFDEAFVRERLAEVRRLLDEPALADHPGLRVRRGDLPGAYRDWAPTYDDPSNGLFAIDAPVLATMLEGLPAGRALDAACGTGRLTELLVERGDDVVGVDQSPEMLDVARDRFPDATFHVGDMRQLPLEDASVDLAISGLAFAHLPDLAPAFAELARVLRPGGHLVVSDAHHELILRGSIVKALGPNGEPGLAPTYRHRTGDVLRAALAADFEVLACEEPGLDTRDARRAPGEPAPAGVIEVGPADTWPWSLLGVVPEATRAAWEVPSVVVWHFRRRR
jgi:SAM-dependent methyltransferase